VENVGKEIIEDCFQRVAYVAVEIGIVNFCHNLESQICIINVFVFVSDSQSCSCSFLLSFNPYHSFINHYVFVQLRKH
jgi:hypothetical protein